MGTTCSSISADKKGREDVPIIVDTGKNTLNYNASKDYDHLFKIIIVGDAGVGKTSLLVRYVENEFDQVYNSTIGIDFKVKTFQVDDHNVKLQIWDTAGQERFQTITGSYYRGAGGVVIVYDVTRPSTFLSIPKWIEDVRKLAEDNIEIVLVGNKIDQEPRIVGSETLQDFAKANKLSCHEVSCKSSMEKIDAVFQQLSRKLIEIHNRNNGNSGSKSTSTSSSRTTNSSSSRSNSSSDSFGSRRSGEEKRKGKEFDFAE